MKWNDWWFTGESLTFGASHIVLFRKVVLFTGISPVGGVLKAILCRGSLSRKILYIGRSFLAGSLRIVGSTVM